MNKRYLRRLELINKKIGQLIKSENKDYERILLLIEKSDNIESKIISEYIIKNEYL